MEKITVYLHGQPREVEADIWEPNRKAFVKDLVVCRFRTGTKTHLSTALAWFKNGKWVVSPAEVIHNKTARVIGWAEQGQGSGWTGKMA